MTTVLNTPQLTINNVSTRYVEGSLVYNTGKGEVNFRTHTAGPGDLEVVTAEDVNTKIGMVKFTLISTVENAALVRQWQSNVGANRITTSLSGLTENFAQMSVSNNPDITTGNDASFEVEFQGNAS